MIKNILALAIILYVVFAGALLCKFSSSITSDNFPFIFLIAIGGFVLLTAACIYYTKNAAMLKASALLPTSNSEAREQILLEKVQAEKKQADREHYFKLLDKAISADDIPGVNRDMIKSIFDKLQNI